MRAWLRSTERPQYLGGAFCCLLGFLGIGTAWWLLINADCYGYSHLVLLSYPPIHVCGDLNWAQTSWLVLFVPMLACLAGVVLCLRAASRPERHDDGPAQTQFHSGSVSARGGAAGPH